MSSTSPAPTIHFCARPRPLPAIHLGVVPPDCSEFWNSGRELLFWLSLSIFFIAQCSYSFLFVATYGDHLSNCGKLCAFLCALPFSQLVPCFTLIESFHLKTVGDLLQFFGLKPTSSIEPPAADADSLWTLLQRKYHAHAGETRASEGASEEHGHVAMLPGPSLPIRAEPCGGAPFDRGLFDPTLSCLS